ncbi:DNA polymerase I [Candidatus Aminicenantes bacterium AC-335-K20]|jgi:DNA polymerase-1|nr:DNA polymerase I [SCandidatus Aminicenantes bacterium Aminicenantia_JdfR_composite]MCP2596708.1 DNA polymerase I [Candidatus Aminicenantes bacterium AC-335-G13]MCP2619424.1 DNA polymerase I [Candidatus Aminicenantes bacterium AC-335-K20]
MSSKKLFLVDGSSLIYRAFFALPRLTTKKGFPTNAIYGFVNMLRKLIKSENPEYLVVAFDVKGPTVRHKLFKEYKAQRPPMPDELQMQIPYIRKILKALNIPIFEEENYEADDVLGSLAKKASQENFISVLVTGDKDFFQLVNDKIIVFNPVKEKYFNRKEIEDYFGIKPEQVIDVLALQGDQSDNIPGIPGIGEKTAKALIKEFGSIDSLIKNLEKIEKNKLKEKIKENLELLEISRELAVIKTDLDIEFNPEKFRLKKPDYSSLINLFRELEFTSLLEEYLKEIEKPEKDYKIIFDENELKKLINEIEKRGFVSIDTETDNPSPVRAELVGISFSFEPNKGYYLPLGHNYPGAPRQIKRKRALELLGKIIASPGIKKIGQNLKYDYIVFKNNGIEMRGIDLDTMLLSYLLDPNRRNHNLDDLALNYLQYRKIPFKEIAGTGKKQLTLDRIEIDKVAFYSCEDADIALQLSSVLFSEVKEKGMEKLYREIELPLVNVLADMEMSGVKIDTSVLLNLSYELEQELEHLKRKIFELSSCEFNINSPQQVSKVLFEELKLPKVKKMKKTKAQSTDIEVLTELASVHPVPKMLLDYRQLAKLKSSYVDSILSQINPKTGRIHTSYNQTVAATGRLSSSEPNLQNIPIRTELGKKLRKAFIPEEGYLFLSADYSQIELRILAHLSEDPALIQTFLNDEDVHQRTAKEVFGEESSLFPEEQRRRAKIINFSIIYGTSAFSLSKELNTTPQEAKKYIEKYFEKYPKVKEYLDKIVKEAGEKGYVKTLFGRIRPIPELKSQNKNVQESGRRMALNTPIQGTAADLMKKAMIDVWREIKKRKLNARMIIQVHDELVFEAKPEEKEELEKIIKDKMENVYPLKVPLKVKLSWGVNWAEV